MPVPSTAASLPRKGGGMRVFLGVDGGGTGCRLRLVDAAGAVLAQAQGGAANIATDPDGARANLLAALAGLLPSGAEVTAVLGLAGANAPGAADRLMQALPFARVRIVSDALTSTVGALAGADGIVAAMGTGSVFASLRHDRFSQVGGWGPALGDEGGGAALGRRRLQHALRAACGLQPLSPFLAETLAQFGGADGVVGFGVTARPTDLAALAPALFASADPAAEAILREEAASFTPFIDLLQIHGSLPVTWTGGLGPLWAARLAGRWPEHPAQGSALDGAVRLAVEAGQG